MFCSRYFHGTFHDFLWDTFPDNLQTKAFITWWMTKVCVSCSQNTCCRGRNVISVCWSGREGERERCAKVGTRELEQGAEMFVQRGSWEVCDGKEICHGYIGGGGQHQGWTLSKRFDLRKQGQIQGRWFVASDGLKDEGTQIGSWSILSEWKTYLLMEMSYLMSAAGLMKACSV